jgi:hypothetical protein
MPEERPIVITNDATGRGQYSKHGNTWNVDSQEVDERSKQVAALEQTLPANDPADSMVHWLGSSYSGADIKILVHMYSDPSNIVAAKDDQDFYNELLDAYSTLAGVVDTIAANGSGNYNAISGLFGEGADSRVVGEIQNFVRRFTNIPDTQIRTSLMRTAVNEKLSETLSMSNSADSYLDTLNTLDSAAGGEFATLALATAQTFSLQTHREKHPVRALGYSNVKGYTRGQRTIAGSIIFTMFNEHGLANLIRRLGSSVNKFDPSPSRENDISSLLIDQLPPLDMTIVFANEYGSLSRGALYGVEFMNSGITLSIEDILTEEVVSFVARDADPVISAGHVGIDRKQRGMHFNREGLPATGTDLLFANKASYEEYLEKLKVRRKLRNR